MGQCKKQKCQFAGEEAQIGFLSSLNEAGDANR